MRASTIYIVMTGLMSLAQTLMFTTYALYYVTMLGLNPLQLLLVGSALEITIFLLEIPTGVLADSYSRRLSVILGTFVLGVAYTLEGSIPALRLAVPAFLTVVGAEVIRGVGETLLSGAQDAWIADEVGAENLGSVYLKATRLNQLMALAGIGGSVLLANVAYNLPYVVGGVLYLLLGGFLVATMPERGFTPAPRDGQNVWQLAGNTFRNGVRAVRGSSILLLILAVSLFAGAASEGYDRLWEAHILKNLTLPAAGHLQPATWFGILSAGATLLGLLAAHIAVKRLDVANPRAITGWLYALTGLRIAGTLAFALAGSFVWAVVAFWSLGIIGTLTAPLFNTWLNQHIESESRATVLSMMSQSNALGQTVGGPFVGAVGTRWSIRSSLLLAAVLLSPTLALYHSVRGSTANPCIDAVYSGRTN